MQRKKYEQSCLKFSNYKNAKDEVQYIRIPAGRLCLKITTLNIKPVL